MELVEKFEKIVHVQPAYDKRDEGSGIHNAVMRMVLKGSKGAVVFAVGTGWYLPKTDQWKRQCINSLNDYSTWEGRGFAVAFCSPVPLEEYQKNYPNENCQWLRCTCYGDQSYIASDEVFDLLVTKGSDAVWEWLEDFYNKTFYKTAAT